MIAARVGARIVTAEAVEWRLLEMRSGLHGASLPNDGTSEGRQLRRCVAQTLVLEELVLNETELRNLAGGVMEDTVSPLPLDAIACLELGTTLALVLRTFPPARSLYRSVTKEVQVAREEIERYGERNQDRYRREPARMVLHHQNGRAVNAGRPYAMHKGDYSGFIGDAVFGAPVGGRVGAMDGHTFIVTAILGDEMEAEELFQLIEGDLVEAARRRFFGLWVESRRAATVTMMPGYEDPADIRQPDSSHRH
jgi:[acyl-carrier-protein] S-malonyltransferase